MKALTLWQPWASLCVEPGPPLRILTGCQADLDNPHVQAVIDAVRDRYQRPFKTIETRSWKAPDAAIGERIAIHAAVRRPDSEPDIVGWRTSPDGAGGYSTRRLAAAARVSPEERLVHVLFPDTDDARAAGYVRLPLGAVVGTATLTACLPMYHIVEALAGVDRTGRELIWPNIQLNGTDNAHIAHAAGGSTDVSDQIPFGHFAPGRWAWLLDDVERFPEPIPARGRQGLWTWTP